MVHTVNAGQTPRSSTSLLLAALLLSCGGAPVAPPAPAELPSPAGASATRGEAARYLVPGAHRIERSDDGVDRVVIDGRRMELRGAELLRLGSAEPELQGGGVAPAWAGEGPNRYVFWRGRELYGAATFDGALHPIATLPAEPQHTFDWVSGVGLHLPGGALVVSPLGSRPLPLGRPAVLRALAADARRALALDGLGSAWLTLDGGGSFKDIRAELGTIDQIEIRGASIAVGLGGGRERFIGPSGAIEDTRAGSSDAGAATRDEDLDLWPVGHEAGALEAAVRTGLPLPDGGVVIAARGFVGRFDPRALRTTSVAPLGDLAGKDAECSAFRARDADLLVCADRERATVIDLAGAPRVERTFDLGGAPDLDRFLGADGEALGFLGACDGRARRASDEPLAGIEAPSPSPSKSAVFCVRKARDAWVEHRLDPVDAAEVVAWIPRFGGGAAAIVARPGAFVSDAERVRVRGDLRVVRVARSEPPLAFQGYSQRSAALLDRSLIVRPDATIEGFVPGSSATEAVLSLSIDARGRVRAYPGPPRAGSVVSAGRFALAHSEEGRLFETVDFGHRWIEVPPPPGASLRSPSHCSPVGCAIGSFVRLGWSGPRGEPLGDPRDDPRDRPQIQRPVPTPVIRLACRFDGPADGKRSAEPYGFGYSAVTSPRGLATVRLGTLGVATFPWGNMGAMTPQGDLELGWVAPLDLQGVVQRRTFSFARAGITAGSPRLREMRLGYLLDPTGELDLLPIGYRDTCPSTLLEQAGLARPLGGCAEDRAVGVDLGGRVVVLRPAYDALVVSAADPPPRRDDGDPRGGKPARAVDPARTALRSALHELRRTPAPSGLRSFALGAGARDGEPVVLVMDVNGEALLAPIDADTGTRGVEERLLPLAAAALGTDAACSGGQRPGEARVVLPFEAAIGLDRSSLRGVLATGSAGVAVLRWSRDRVCLDAVELAVRDERYEPDLGLYEGSGAVRKLIARFTAPGTARPAAKARAAKDPGGGAAALVLIGQGYELRQPLRCTGLLPGEQAPP